MPKSTRKKKSRGNTRAHPYIKSLTQEDDGDTSMLAASPFGDAAPQGSGQQPNVEGLTPPTFSFAKPEEKEGAGHAVFKRQAAEWKAMKAEVAKLKKERSKLPRKARKDAKKKISQKIRKLIDTLRTKHSEERKTAGLPLGQGPADTDMADDDDEEDEI